MRMIFAHILVRVNVFRKEEFVHIICGTVTKVTVFSVDVPEYHFNEIHTGKAARIISRGTVLKFQ